ncbi:MAG: transglycosylase SLT domain-containing protein, partial [Candidatus Saccharimonadales bacterium]
MLVAGGLIVAAGFGLDKLYRNHQSAIPYQAAGVNAPWIPSTVKYWNGTIDEMGKKYDVDPNLIAIIMTLESGGYAKANSGEAQGLMQITPVTAKDIASKYLKKPVSNYNLWDPKTNIEFGTAYLAELRKLFQEPNQAPSWDFTVEQVAASYNAGFIGGIHLQEGKGIHDLQALQYSGDAFNMWRERHTSDSPTFDRWKDRGGSLLI